MEFTDFSPPIFGRKNSVKVILQFMNWFDEINCMDGREFHVFPHYSGEEEWKSYSYQKYFVIKSTLHTVLATKWKSPEIKDLQKFDFTTKYNFLINCILQEPQNWH